MSQSLIGIVQRNITNKQGEYLDGYISKHEAILEILKALHECFPDAEGWSTKSIQKSLDEALHGVWRPPGLAMTTARIEGALYYMQARDKVRHFKSSGVSRGLWRLYDPVTDSPWKKPFTIKKRKRKPVAKTNGAAPKQNDISNFIGELIDENKKLKAELDDIRKSMLAYKEVMRNDSLNENR
jgi:hypothetical protein